MYYINHPQGISTAYVGILKGIKAAYAKIVTKINIEQKGGNSCCVPELSIANITGEPLEIRAPNYHPLSFITYVFSLSLNRYLKKITNL